MLSFPGTCDLGCSVPSIRDDDDEGAACRFRDNPHHRSPTVGLTPGVSRFSCPERLARGPKADVQGMVRPRTGFGLRVHGGAW
jgi:hypothetical protein